MSDGSGLTAAFYGDDVTGSVDALLQFARQGLSGRLFVGRPSRNDLELAASECAVVGIAGIARSLPPRTLDAEVRPALAALAALRPHVLQYKACSTIDSSPEVGSIGRVMEIGRDIVGAHTVPMLFAQPDFGRYTLFGHHFAREGDVVHRLDRQPTMSQHPSTPMTESDVARHLALQTDLPIGGIPLIDYTDAAALAARIRSADTAALILDALDDSHLRLIGGALRLLPGPVFAIGSGGLSRAIASAARAAAVDASTEPAGTALPQTTPARGPVLAVSGSRSPQTRRQVQAARRAGWHSAALPLDPSSRGEQITDVVAILRSGRSVVMTSEDADTTQSDLLERIADAAAAVVVSAAKADAASRVIVCGGDTSGRVAHRIGADSLSIAANPWGNVVLLRVHSHDTAVDGLELVLKGGQVGAEGLLEDVRVLGA